MNKLALAFIAFRLCASAVFWVSEGTNTDLQSEIDKLQSETKTENSVEYNGGKDLLACER